ncbi:MAG: Holliday junction branch migration protein RuvA [Candidatus Neomarinimicrobiota bacterium]
MIVRLAGRLLEKHPDHVVMDVQGVGYHIWITLNTYEALPRSGEEATLLTYHQVREDSQDLFGFASAEEREVFKHLIAISGIGAKTAITILSGALPAELRRRVQEGDEAALTAIRGVGPKMARRILIELRDKFGAEVPAWDSITATATASDTVTQAIDSLVALGYRRHEARRAVQAALKKLDAETPVEDLIRAALSGK